MNSELACVGIRASSLGAEKSTNGVLSSKGALNLAYMDRNLADAIKVVTKEMLVYLLKDLISDSEIAGTWDRINRLKTAIQKQEELDPTAFITLDIEWENNKQDIIYALNEIRIENPFHTLISDVFIDNEMLETFRGNGLMVSSSVGSSAYNKSLGGALIDNEIEALELTEVAGIENRVYHSLGSSLIIKGDKKVVFSGKLGNAVVGYDSLNCSDISNLEKVEISYSDKKVKIIYSENHTYVQKIRKSFDL